MSHLNLPDFSLEEALSATIDGLATPQEQDLVEDRLRTDPGTAEALAELRYTIALLAELPAVPIPRSFTLTADQVTSRPHALWAWLVRLKPLYLQGAAALVAICLLLLAVGDVGLRAGFLPASQQPGTVQSGPEALSPDQGDPTAIIGKASTSELESSQQPTWLGLTQQQLLVAEVGLFLLLVLLSVALWQLGRLLRGI